MILVDGTAGQGVTTAMLHVVSQRPRSSIYISWNATATVREFTGELRKRILDMNLSGECPLVLLDHLDNRIGLLALLHDLHKTSRNRFSLFVRFNQSNMREILWARPHYGLPPLRPMVINVQPPNKSEVREIAKLHGVTEWENLFLNVRSFTELYQILKTNEHAK